MKTLRPYQEQSQVILARDASGIDGSDMGTGKTLTGVERVRAIAEEVGRIPRVLVVAPANTQRQWLALFAEQFPHLGASDHLRIVGTFRSDPESWNNFMLRKKAAGVFIIGWEAMRGLTPKSIKIISQEAADRRTQAQETTREAKKILARKRSSTEEKEAAHRLIAQAGKDMVLRRTEQKTVSDKVPEGWVPLSPGGASRGYGKLYKSGRTLTKQAVQAAARTGDVPPWHRTGTWDLVIADESHRMANADSANKTVMTLIKALNKLAMSATFAGNKPEGAWSTLNWLWPKLYSSFWNWAKIFLEIEVDQINDHKSVKKIVGEVDPGATWLDIPCKVRHRVADIRGQLPEVIERIVEVDMTEVQRRIYDDFADESLAWIDDHPVGAPLPITQRIRMRQAALGKLKIHRSVRTVDEWLDNAQIADSLAPYDEPYEVLDVSDDGQEVLVRTSEDVEEIDFDEKAQHPKLDMIKDILTDLPAAEPVMIYTHSAKWAHMAAAVLGSGGMYGDVRAWTGALSKRKRDDLKDSFGTPGGPRIIVAQLNAVAEGTDGLQHRCACEIWASPVEDGLINNQAMGRLNRDGQTRPVQRWLLHSAESIDIGLDESLRIRRKQMSQFYRDDKKGNAA